MLSICGFMSHLQEAATSGELKS